MNLLLFEQHELNAGCLLLTDNRAKHIRTVLKLNVGDALRIGMVNGKMGRRKDYQHGMIIRSNWRYS